MLKKQACTICNLPTNTASSSFKTLWSHIFFKGKIVFNDLLVETGSTASVEVSGGLTVEVTDTTSKTFLLVTTSWDTMSAAAERFEAVVSSVAGAPPKGR